MKKIAEVDCPRCNGTGKDYNQYDLNMFEFNWQCPKCMGLGKIDEYIYEVDKCSA